MTLTLSDVKVFVKKANIKKTDKKTKKKQYSNVIKSITM